MNSKSAIVALVTVTAALVGCNQPTAEQMNMLYGAQRAYAAGDYNRSVRSASDFLALYAKGKDACRAYYVRGVAEVKLNQRQRAFADLESAATDATDLDAAWRARATLGVMHFEDQRYGLAINFFETAFKDMPGRPPRDWYMYRYGQSLERVGRWSEARTQFERIMAEFPTSGVLANAKRRVTLNADHFAIQCGAYSQKENAAKAAADLGRSGFPAGMFRESRPNGEVWVVRVGRYRTYVEAQAAQNQLRRITTDAVIWP